MAHRRRGSFTLQKQFDALGDKGWSAEQEAAYVAENQNTVASYMEKWNVKLEDLTGGMLELYKKYGLAEPHALGGIASGLSLVGEEGPELVNFTRPATVLEGKMEAIDLCELIDRHIQR